MSDTPKKRRKKKPEPRDDRKETKGELPPSLDIKKLGRPTDYDPEYCDLVLQMGAEGKSRTQICAGLGIGKTTAQRWEAKYDEFRVALSEAKDLAQAWWEDLGQRNVLNSDLNNTVYVFSMKNRFRDDYTDVHRLEHTGKDGGAIEYSTTSISAARRVAFALGKSLERRKVIDITPNSTEDED